MAAAIPSSTNNEDIKIQVDPDAVLLSEWCSSLSNDASIPPPKCRVPGLVLVAEWGWANTVAEEYENLRTHTTASTNNQLFCYPSHSSHITIATLSSFKKQDSPRAHLSKEEDDEFVQAWIEALKIELSSHQFQAFEVEAEKVEISPGAAFILFRDDSGTILKLRSVVEHIRDNNNKINELNERHRGNKIRGGVHVPDIIHSSYGRFIKQQPLSQPTDINKVDDMSSGDDDSKRPEELLSGNCNFGSFKLKFDQTMSSCFEPFKIKVETITLANENSPYMHQNQSEESLFVYDLRDGCI
jgi:hypothetical protein